MRFQSSFESTLNRRSKCECSHLQSPTKYPQNISLSVQASPGSRLSGKKQKQNNNKTGHNIVAACHQQSWTHSLLWSDFCVCKATTATKSNWGAYPSPCEELALFGDTEVDVLYATRVLHQAPVAHNVACMCTAVMAH